MEVFILAFEKWWEIFDYLPYNGEFFAKALLKISGYLTAGGCNRVSIVEAWKILIALYNNAFYSKTNQGQVRSSILLR